MNFKSSTWIATAIVGGCLVLSAQAQSRYIAFNMNGGQENPPVSSLAVGSAALVFNAATNTLTVNVVTSGITNATAAHVHRAPSGVNGPVVFGLTGGPNNWSGSGVLSAADVALLRNEGLYVNVHSSANPGGEIRGQIILPPIVINEFQYDDSGTDDREYVELYNRTAFPLDISGWRLEAADASTVPDNNPDYVLSGLIPAGGYFVVGAALVPNVNQVVGTTNLWENDQETLSLRDGLDVIHDTVTYETNRNENPGTFPLDRREGDGVWGNLTSVDLHESAWARLRDGYDSDNNRDFVLLVSTPGTNNNPSVVTSINENFDSLIQGSQVPNWNGSFKEPIVVDPTFASGDNPSAIPASPQGGQAATFWDNSGGGNANVLLTQPFEAITAEGYFYLQGNPYPATYRESWSFGVMGSAATFFNEPDPSGTLGFTANGNTGVSWTMQITDTAATLYLVDHNDGGVGAAASTGTNVLATIPIQLGVNDGWQRLYLSVCRGKVRARFGGTTGQNDGQLFTGTTTIAQGMVYIGYREFVLDNSTLRPVTLDAFSVSNVAGIESFGVAAATNNGTPTLGANSCPFIGNSSFAIELSGLGAGSSTLLLGDFFVLNPAINLGLLGGNPAGELYVLPSVSATLPTTGAGTATFAAAIPLDPTLVGGQFTFQDLDLDFTLPFSLPIGTSRGMTVIIQ